MFVICGGIRSMTSLDATMGSVCPWSVRAVKAINIIVQSIRLTIQQQLYCAYFTSHILINSNAIARNKPVGLLLGHISFHLTWVFIFTN